MTHYSYDAEFHERGPYHPIELISIGIVSDDGRELYAISNEFDQPAAWKHPFLREYVLPHLPWVTPARGTRGSTHPRLDLDHPDVHSRARIARLIERFLSEGDSTPVLWADHAGYDHVVLAQLWGTMVDLPTTIPMYTREIRQEILRRKSELRPIPEPQMSDHHPLHEARTSMEQLRLMGSVTEEATT